MVSSAIEIIIIIPVIIIGIRRIVIGSLASQAVGSAVCFTSPPPVRHAVLSLSFGRALPPSGRRTMSNNGGVVPTLEELRTKRLVALGILPQQQQQQRQQYDPYQPLEVKPSASKDTNKTSETAICVDLWDDDSDEPIVVATKNKRTELIDLLDDDDDDSSSASSRHNRAKNNNNSTTVPHRRTPKRQGDTRSSVPTTAPSSKRPCNASSAASSPENTIPVESSSRDLSSAQRTFRVATWNVWFGPMGDGAPHAGPRMRAISRLLQQDQAQQLPLLWCVGFQEVIPTTAQLLEPLWTKAGYHWFCPPSRAPYFCAMAIHSSLVVLEQGWIPFAKTSMSRGFLYARARLPHSSDQILFATTHLESYNDPSYTGAEQRPLQLREMQAFGNAQFHKTVPNHLQAAILTGDMNWDDERVRSSGLDEPMTKFLSSGDWNDSWLVAKPGMSGSKKSTCFTYDGKMNPMLGNNLRRRFDRILVRSGGTANPVTVVGTDLLGTTAIPELYWPKRNSYTRQTKETPTAPSDHFGYVATLSID